MGFILRPVLRTKGPFNSCIICHIIPHPKPSLRFRQLSTSSNLLQEGRTNTSPATAPEKKNGGRPDYTPVRLMQPFGFESPPKVGENSGIDTRTLQQKRDDFVNWDKHLEKRKRLTAQFTRSYFADFNTLSREHKGKTFIAPPKLFRADKSLYFPNLQGRTLIPPRKQAHDTTPVLVSPGSPRVSLVAMYSSLWGQNQTKSFVEHPDVAELLGPDGVGGLGGKVQRVDINVELNPLKAWFIHLFVGSLRKSVPPVRHGRYFIVRRGLTGAMREHLGMLNGRVGYVYLLDWEARIRWAGSGIASQEEIEALCKGIRKLAVDAEEARKGVEAGKVVGTVEEEKEAAVDVAGGAA